MAGDLKVCPKCGWYDGHSHARECDPAAGRLADALAALVPEIPSSKLGHGFGHISFVFDEDHGITFQVSQRGFSVHGVQGLFWLGAEPTKRAVALVRMLAAHRRGEG